MIKLSGICKTFKVARRSSGFGQAVRALFSREYKYIRALDDVSFEIPDGAMVGYIGPNGAGKSSTIKIMSGILVPDSGECEINGLVPWRDRVKHVANIGVVFGQRSQLWWDVPVCDSFELIRDIYKIPPRVYSRNLGELTESLELTEIIRTPARQLSLGQRMRCEIAASLLHDPKVLFLDEPTIGLDAVSKIAVREFIKRQNRERGTTVILTTHDMQDIEALTERIILIGKGKILLDGSFDELKRRASRRRTLSVDFTGGAFEVPAGLHAVKMLDGHAVFTLDSENVSVSDAIAAISARVNITDISVDGATAEEMVVSLYEEYKI